MHNQSDPMIKWLSNVQWFNFVVYVCFFCGYALVDFDETNNRK